ncbi:unnamed protein product [Ectocarpus sp. 12 AP-2014]
MACGTAAYRVGVGKSDDRAASKPQAVLTLSQALHPKGNAVHAWNSARVSGNLEALQQSMGHYALLSKRSVVHDWNLARPEVLSRGSTLNWPRVPFGTERGSCLDSDSTWTP